MADSLNGYLYDFNVYMKASGADRETGLGEKVVLQLAELIKGNYLHLYFDNYFSYISISLLSKLLEDGYICMWNYTYQSRTVSN